MFEFFYKVESDNYKTYEEIGKLARSEHDELTLNFAVEFMKI